MRVNISARLYSFLATKLDRSPVRRITKMVTARSRLMSAEACVGVSVCRLELAHSCPKRGQKAIPFCTVLRFRYRVFMRKTAMRCEALRATPRAANVLPDMNFRVFRHGIPGDFPSWTSWVRIPSPAFQIRAAHVSRRALRHAYSERTVRGNGRIPGTLRRYST